MTPATAAAPLTDTAVDAIVARHGAAERTRAEAGVRRVRERWTAQDGNAETFDRFCVDHYVPAAKANELLDRLEAGMTWIGGHLYELRRHLRRFSDMRVERIDAIDDVLATFDPAPDLSDQWYRQKLAFVALLNFDRPALDRMLSEGDAWSPARWAEARLTQAFPPRIPAELNDRARAVNHRANRFVSEFHVPVGTLVDATGARRFEKGRKLVAHWLVREAIKSGYAAENGLAMQRALAWTMARHIDGTIPRAVMDSSSDADWDPARNTLGGAPATETVGLTRYQIWLERRDIAFEYDRHYTDYPTAIRRKCELEREIPEREVERVLVELLSSPVRRDLAAFLRTRIGRPLEAFDIYCDEFVQQRPIEELDRRVKERIGDGASMERRLPEILMSLGYDAKDAEFFGARIRVEIARGAGHAVRPGVPELPAWLRTSTLEGNLGWDGFDTAMHELGHTLEQVISTHFAPRPALRNVPNTACTEAFAFLYQSLARKALGLVTPEEERLAFDYDSVQTFASACQIAGPSLLELRVWNWIYANPTADAAALRNEVLRVADDIWRTYYEQDFGPDPYRLLAAYQHMLSHPLYLPDYALGHIMSHQIRSFVRSRDLAAETKRICSIGRVTPDLWMRRAVGRGISAAALEADAKAALARL
ncbi:MAG: hypothetical protein JNM94_04835 [Phycisphaerae bacterium]|nr:hypothetical protein [Phycisphaerae bacterium]